MPYASKEELYALVWQQGDTCNLSGVKGDWSANSLTKLSFDEIVPRNPADENVKVGWEHRKINFFGCEQKVNFI